MKILIVIIRNLLILSVVIYSCNPSSKERTKSINCISTINEKEQRSDLVWIDETQGYFIDSRDSTQYKVVKIGTQTWMAENLVYKPGSGDFWAYDDDQKNVAKYGYLYFWETAKSACPTGWHIPSNEEWNTLIYFFGGKDLAGGSLKATIGWDSPNEGATNSSLLSILPGGNRAIGGKFYHLGDNALLWSSTTKNTLSAYRLRINFDNTSVSLDACGRLTGLSVRCIKD